ncbi:MAG: hypothetical protein JWL75_779 [Parcubacteria group bacterium]|nr:hypothetical protein [Parcubacteria group bacterium]
MRRLLLIPLFLLPLAAGAATLGSTSTTVPTNAYLAQSSVDITKPLPADLVTAGLSVKVDAPVAGDVLAVGGTLTVSKGADGNVRVIGGKVMVSGPVAKDLAAAGGTVHLYGPARTIYAAGGSVDVEGGSSGNVTIYGVNVFLSGDYAGNVSVVASNQFTLGENTHIHGTLSYSAPSSLKVPAAAVIDGGARYSGAYAYVPTNEQAHQYAVLGTIIFFAVRVFAGIIVAGLIAGLFTAFSERIVGMLYVRDWKKLLKLFLIGLAIGILTPVLCLFLLISFVGAGLSFLLIVLYALLALLAYAFAGMFLGAVLRYTLLYKIKGTHEFSWRDAVLGTVILHAVGLIPFIGTIILVLLTLMCAGALATFAYRTAFDGRG